MENKHVIAMRDTLRRLESEIDSKSYDAKVYQDLYHQERTNRYREENRFHWFEFVGGVAALVAVEFVALFLVKLIHG